MTDVRGVIADTIPGTNAKRCHGLADAIISRLDAAGYRILGPGEVDPVTLEKAAEAAEEQAEWVPLKAGDMRAAIRALGRKA